MFASTWFRTNQVNPLVASCEEKCQSACLVFDGLLDVVCTLATDDYPCLSDHTESLVVAGVEPREEGFELGS
jgi:hypothetical protein